MRLKVTLKNIITLGVLSFSTLAANASDLRVGEIGIGSVDKVARRQRALSLSGYSFGPARAFHRDGENLYQVAYTNHREATTQGEVRLRLGAAAAEDGESYFMNGTVGGAYHFLRTSVSPLVGAEFGLGAAGGEDDGDVGGFVAAALAGVRFFRTSTTQLELLGRCDRLFQDNEQDKQATTCGLSLSALF